ncbi:MAG: cation:proton antiporter [Verrucomicrobiae bacterium]|nr:cation:proton antiporter [Verrucomicrobiae bacterium]
MDPGPLTDIALCIVAAWLFGVVAQVLRQPVLLAYLVAGYVIGPAGFGIVTNEASIDSISGIGLLLLLFVIGLEIDLKRVIGAGRPIFVTATVQILGTVAIVLAFFTALDHPLGKGHFEAIYLAVAAAASSTVIAVKILTDRAQLDTLAGRITVGVSVLQDVAVIVFLGIQPALDSPSALVLATTTLKIGILIGVTLGVSRYILPSLFHRVATLPELVSVGALAWCFVIAALAHFLGLSREMGALVAGVALSTFPYHLDVAAKVTSLRDFFITLFFVGLGLTIPPPTLHGIGWALVLAALVVLSRALTVLPPLRLLGLGNRVAFLASINLMPLSEFALVLVALGVEAGHLEREMFAPVVYAFFLLAVAGSYAIAASDRLFLATEPWLRRLGLRDRQSAPESRPADPATPDLFLLGFYGTASSLLEEIARNHPDWLPRLAVVDFNPDVHRRLVRRGVHTVWGDISQRDTLKQAGLQHARVVLCTLPNSVLRGTDNLRLVRLVRSLNPDACLVAHAEVLVDVPRLREAGATFVLVPRLRDADDLVAAIHAADNRLLPDLMAALELRLSGRQEIVP